MNRSVWGVFLLISWAGSAVLTVICWPIVSRLDVASFDAWVWFVLLFCLNWLGINTILSVFFVRGVPSFVLTDPDPGE